jgi:hypothetical protein
MSHDWLNAVLTHLRRRALILDDTPPEPNTWRERFLREEQYLDWCFMEHRDPEATETMVAYEQWYAEQEQPQ